MGSAVCKVSWADILGAPNSAQLIAEYAAECLIPGAKPQAQMYADLEHTGRLACFGAYVDGELVGFASELSGIMPHDGKRRATIESLFVSAGHRDTGAGLELIGSAEQYAAESGSTCLICTARVGSAFDIVLSRRPGYSHTHNQHTRWLP